MTKYTSLFYGFIASILKRRGKHAFVRHLPYGARLLDVGCGNNSPYSIKLQRPDIYYVGIDVGDYNQTKPNLADEYIVTTPETFPGKIANFGEKFDAVISAHNLEHCYAPDEVIAAMAAVLRPEGRLYLSFPCEKSVEFPSRIGGTLNYYDDPTHRGEPPCFNEVIKKLKNCECDMLITQQYYRPLLMWFLGCIEEPLSRYLGKVLFGTWSFYGFESVIWAKKI